MPQGIPLFSIVLLSAAALAYEVLLMRLFSIIQWHHFAYMIISLALLGYGISGTLIALFQKKLLKHFNYTYPGLLILFSLSTLSCYLIVQQIPFNAEEILWDSYQLIYLLGIFLLLTIPFVFAASAICLAMAQYPDSIPRIYSMDLLGAGAGSLLIILLLFLVFPMTALVLIALLGLLSAFISVKELNLNQHWLMPGIVIAGGIIILAGLNSSLNISPYKELRQVLRINGTQIISQRSSPLGLLSIVESSDIPLRHVPGLSLNNVQEPLAQLGVFTDAGNMTAISRYPQNRAKLAYLDQLSSVLPYHLKKIQRLLIVGAGGGSDILQAQFHQVDNIDAVDINAQVVDLLQNEFSKYSGNLYQQHNIKVHVNDVRGFLSTIDTDKKAHQFDLIQMSLMDSFSTSTASVSALQESYLYTQEALQLYMQHLSADGYLAISRWVKVPPRDTLKMFATAIKALKQSNKKNIRQHLILIRSWQVSTLLIKNSAFSKAETEALKIFCQQRSFDVAWYPGISETEVNYYNIFAQPYFYQGAIALLGEHPEKFLQEYKYYLYPATDDQPFFHHFFKWSVLPELFSLRGQGGFLLIEMGYLIHIATLLLAIVASIVLILLPLLAYRKTDLINPVNNNSINSSPISRSKLFLYFFMIGLAFLFIEIAFMQKFILFLHHPIYSITIVLAAFLINAGIGSALSRQLVKNYSSQKVIQWAIWGIIVLSLLYIVILNPMFSSLMALSYIFKIGLSLILITPLAICMGMPFPLALSSLSNDNDGQGQAYIPWAWGVNGCASVISAVLSGILAIYFGFTIVVLIAITLYYLCLLLFPGIIRK